MNNKENYTNYHGVYGGYIPDQNIRKHLIRSTFHKINKYICRILKDVPLEDIYVLEIGCGQGHFADYCKSLGIKNYVGFDLDKSIVSYCRTILPNYTFYDGDIYNYLDQNIGKYTIVFMSNVFEHIPINLTNSIIKKIYASLISGGIWLNIMPNAGASFGRYNDNTHIKLYTDRSFSQELTSAYINPKNIFHYNIDRTDFLGRGRHSLILKFIRKFIRYILISFFVIAGYPVGNVSTFEILSIVKK